MNDAHIIDAQYEYTGHGKATSFFGLCSGNRSTCGDRGMGLALRKEVVLDARLLQKFVIVTEKSSVKCIACASRLDSRRFGIGEHASLRKREA
jgi:hypothetical protein